MTPGDREPDTSLDLPGWVNDEDDTAPAPDTAAFSISDEARDLDQVDTEAATPAAPSSATSRLLSATAVMASGTLLSRIFGFVRTALIAFVLGNGTRQVDMFTLANTIPNSLYILLAGGALNTVLVPQIVRAMKKDPDGGLAYTNRIMTAFLTIIFAVTVLITFAAPLFVRLYTSDAWKSPELAAQFDSMVTLAYFCLPQIFFYGAFFLAGQVLNARERFGPMMWAPIANNIVSIGVLSIYLVIWGTGGDGSGAFTNQQELLLGLGSTFGIVVQAAILVPYLRLAGFRYRPRFDWRGVGLGHTFSLAKWTLGFVAVTQLALVVVNRLATSATAAGSGAGLTVYNNAYLLWIMPHSLITVSLATAMLPSASRLAEAGDLAGVRDETTRTMKLAVTVLLPTSLGFIALALPIAQLLFGNGAGAADAEYIGWALMTLAVGLVPFTLHYICLRALYALEDTRSAFGVQVVISAANVLFAIALVSLLQRPSLVAASLGLAYSLAYVVGLVVVWRILQRKIPGLSFWEIMRHLGRLAVAAVPAAGLALVVAWLFSQWSTSFVPLALGLLCAAVVAIGTYFGIAHVLRMPEVREIVNVLRRRGPAAPETADPVPDDERTDVSSEANTGDFDEPDLAEQDEPDDDASDDDFTEPTTTLMPAFDADDAAATMVHARWSLDEADLPTRDLAAVTDDDDDTEETIRPQIPGWQANAGDRLGERYELEELTTTNEGIQTWRAFDAVLSRSVLVHLVGAGDPRTDRVMNAARNAAVATDARFLRVLDVVDDPDGSYVVSEFSPGRTLHEVLLTGPLSARESAWLVRELADGLAVMHQESLHHQRINPDTVIITPTGNVKIVGFLVEAALHPPLHIDDPERIDVRDLGRILYATLVSRWPGEAAHGLPAAPQRGARLLSPRQVRAGVSPALDRVCDQILGDPARHGFTPLTTATDVVSALAAILGTTDASQELEARIRYPVPAVGQRDNLAESPDLAYHAQQALPPGVDDPVPPEPSSNDSGEPGRRWLSILIAFVLVVFLLSLVGVFVQRQLDTTGPAQDPPGAVEDEQQAAGPIPIANGIDFDPSADGGNGEENPGEVPLAFDGDPETRWRTLSYLNNPQFGRLKPGLGLVLDLEEPADVSLVSVLLSGSGTDLELRIPSDNPEAAEPPMTSANEWTIVAEASGATDTVELVPADGSVRTRWVLVYLTSLPPEDGNYRGGIYEIEVRG